MTRGFAPPPGLLIAPVDAGWVAYSPLSGETMVLNNESAAILEVLEGGATDLDSVCAQLANDVGVDAATLAQTIEGSWSQLIEAGLIADAGLPA